MEKNVDYGASCDSITTKNKRPVPSVGDSSAKIRRQLMPSVSGRSHRDSKMANILNYGSEEESDKEEEGITQPLGAPRMARMLMDEEDEEVERGSINFTLERPSQLRRPSISVSTPASPTPVSPTPVEPNNKFKFDWRAFPMSQFEPHLRREPFSQINCGPTVSFTNPYEAFISIWNREIMDLIVRETNLYSQQLATTMLENGMIRPTSRITRWHDTNVDELYTYFAIILAMSLVVKSHAEEYWSNNNDIFNTPGFSTYMSYDRFMLISKCLHFSNNVHYNSELLTQPQDKLFKIKPIIDHLNCKYSELFILSQNVTLHESFTMRKGLLDNQLIPNKGPTIGVKIFEVCESKTGYLWRFEVYVGHDISALQEDNQISGTIPSLVLRLLNGLEHKGHTVWMDNFYNSPALARELKVRGFDCAGTLSTNRQFVPSELANISEKDMIVGQVVGCTSEDVDVMVWRDIGKREAFISTYHGVSSTRCGETLNPSVVLDYNTCMGVVDRKAHQLSMYPIERKSTQVWYKKIFRRLLHASILNAHILLGNQLLTHRKFRKALIIDLLSAHGTRISISKTITKLHTPAQYDLIKSGKTDRLKRKCAVCGKRTITYCKACNVAMCLFTCYEPYHNSH
uniref:PiggyBac transposable element-derived protein domain-containing protein n=1 Tax=Bombyx mori TaxID=7091 RepID=A0A8R2M5U9_BOMMO|nr:piggyBac transposable element-derived protein 4 isoform X2 [Bombyx mori]